MFMTVYGQILYIQKSLDKRKQGNSSLLCERKFAKRRHLRQCFVLSNHDFTVVKKRRTFVKVPLRLGLKTFEKGRQIEGGCRV